MRGLSLFLSFLCACSSASMHAESPSMVVAAPEQAPSPGLFSDSASTTQPTPRPRNVGNTNNMGFPQAPNPSTRLAPPQPVDETSPVIAHEQKMLVYTAHMWLSVYQIEPQMVQVEQLAKSVKGYISSRGDSEIVIRVPRDRFEEALQKIGTFGDVVHKQLNAEDVTDQYADIEVRLRNARVMRNRLEEILQKATVKEALEIEKELGRITLEIESLEGKLKLLQDRIAFSAITITFQGRGSVAVRDTSPRLPFGWLSQLGLPQLMNLAQRRH